MPAKTLKVPKFASKPNHLDQAEGISLFNKIYDLYLLKV